MIVGPNDASGSLVCSPLHDLNISCFYGSRSFAHAHAYLHACIFCQKFSLQPEPQSFPPHFHMCLLLSGDWHVHDKVQSFEGFLFFFSRNNFMFRCC